MVRPRAHHGSSRPSVPQFRRSVSLLALWSAALFTLGAGADTCDRGFSFSGESQQRHLSYLDNVLVVTARLERPQPPASRNAYIRFEYGPSGLGPGPEAFLNITLGGASAWDLVEPNSTTPWCMDCGLAQHGSEYDMTVLNATSGKLVFRAETMLPEDDIYYTVLVRTAPKGFSTHRKNAEYFCEVRPLGGAHNKSFLVPDSVGPQRPEQLECRVPLGASGADVIEPDSWFSVARLGRRSPYAAAGEEPCFYAAGDQQRQPQQPQQQGRREQQQQQQQQQRRHMATSFASEAPWPESGEELPPGSTISVLGLFNRNHRYKLHAALVDDLEAPTASVNISLDTSADSSGDGDPWFRLWFIVSEDVRKIASDAGLRFLALRGFEAPDRPADHPNGTMMPLAHGGPHHYILPKEYQPPARGEASASGGQTTMWIIVGAGVAALGVMAALHFCRSGRREAPRSGSSATSTQYQAFGDTNGRPSAPVDTWSQPRTGETLLA